MWYINRGQVTVRPSSHKKYYPLSFQQYGMWFMSNIDPTSPVMNIFLCKHLKGHLHLGALLKALHEITSRHSSLRTKIKIINDEPHQIMSDTVQLNMSIVDISNLNISERAANTKKLSEQEIRRPFDLRKDTLFRAKLIVVAEQEYILLLVMHHIISDHASCEIIWEELATSYNSHKINKRTSLAPLKAQYHDFSLWQRALLDNMYLKSQEDYWLNELSGGLPKLNLSKDVPLQPIQNYKGNRCWDTIDTNFKKMLISFGLRNRIALSSILLSACYILLYQYSGQKDIIIGTIFSGRYRQELLKLVGMLVNTVTIRINPRHIPTYMQLLALVQEKTARAYHNQIYPFQKLIQKINPERTIDHSPLFTVLFNLVKAHTTQPQFDGLRQINLEQIQLMTSQFDLSINIVDCADYLQLYFEYRADAFKDDAIKRMLKHFTVVLKSIVTSPNQHLSDCHLLTESEQRQLLIEWNNTRTDCLKDKCIHQLFEEQVEKTPDAIALVFEGHRLTYEELNIRANQLAHYLRKRDVGSDVPVGICIERSLEMVIGLLGILKAGGAYVPLDPVYPKERLALMLEDTQVSVLLTQESLLKSIPKYHAHVACLDLNWDIIAHNSRYNPNNTVLTENLAYIIYTSGSTGKPKGVCCNHTGVINLLAGFDTIRPLSMGDRCSFWTSLNFDVSVYEIFSSLLFGGVLYIVPNDKYFASSKFIDWLTYNQIQSAYIPPFMLGDIPNYLAKKPNQLTLRRLLVGVEPISEKLLISVNRLTPDLQIINGYGPTESTICATQYTIQPHIVYNRTTPIGKPVQNIQIYLLDHHLKPTTIGVSAELYIGGIGLARCYLNRPSLTAEKFIPNPFSDKPGTRLYKTGDLARYLPDGNIEFIGRIDKQVKIRGFRIELGEIEAALLRHEVIKKSAVVVSDNEQDNKKLIAYIVCSESISSLSLRRFLRNILPDYMIPSQYVQLDAIPLTPNGKVDYKLLQSLTAEHAIQRTTYIPPATLTEKQIAEIWKNLLGVDKVGIDDNFFDLGGHSLLLAKEALMIENKLNVQIPLKEFFNQTLGQLAAVCEEKIFKNENSDTNKNT